MPEQCQENDYWQWHAKQPKQCTSSKTHDVLLEDSLGGPRMAKAKVPENANVIADGACQPGGTNAVSPPFLQSERNSIMVAKHGDQIVESTQEARQAERGPTVRNVLIASTCLAVAVLVLVWLVFFRT
jgi:hypothetical protein